MAVAGLHPSKTRETLEVHGRIAYVYRPDSCPSSGVPAVMLLHGSGEEAKNMFGVGMEQQADLHGFLVVYPEMSEPFSDEWGYGEDVPYFAELATRLHEPDFDVDLAQLFVCGHSAGGTMAALLQNEMDIFAAAGMVESAVGHLEEWDLTRRGTRTMVIWNHADPVLEEYAPEGGEPAYYALTLSTLRRGARMEPATSQSLPLSGTVTQAQLLTFEEDDAAPEVQILSWTSDPGRHTWAHKSWTGTVDASEHLVAFFLRGKTVARTVV